MRLLISVIVKKDKSDFKERANKFYKEYPSFFDEFDYKITCATNEFENLIFSCLHSGILKGEESDSLYLKLKRLIVRTSNTSLSLEKILNDQKVLIYYQDLPENYLN